MYKLNLCRFIHTINNTTSWLAVWRIVIYLHVVYVLAGLVRLRLVLPEKIEHQFQKLGGGGLVVGGWGWGEGVRGWGWTGGSLNFLLLFSHATRHTVTTSLRVYIKKVFAKQGSTVCKTEKKKPIILSGLKCQLPRRGFYKWHFFNCFSGRKYMGSAH